MAEKPLPAHIVGPLMDKLGSDDKFREQFQVNPKEALSSLGVIDDLDVHANAASACLSANSLPSKEKFDAARKEMATTSNARFEPYDGLKPAL